MAHEDEITERTRRILQRTATGTELQILPMNSDAHPPFDKACCSAIRPDGLKTRRSELFSSLHFYPWPDYSSLNADPTVISGRSHRPILVSSRR